MPTLRRTCSFLIRPRGSVAYGDLVKSLLITGLLHVRAPFLKSIMDLCPNLRGMRCSTIVLKNPSEWKAIQQSLSALGGLESLVLRCSSAKIRWMPVLHQGNNSKKHGQTAFRRLKFLSCSSYTSDATMNNGLLPNLRALYFNPFNPDTTACLTEILTRHGTQLNSMHLETSPSPAIPLQDLCPNLTFLSLNTTSLWQADSPYLSPHDKIEVIMFSTLSLEMIASSTRQQLKDALLSLNRHTFPSLKSVHFDSYTTPTLLRALGEAPLSWEHPLSEWFFTIVESCTAEGIEMYVESKPLNLDTVSAYS